MVNGRDLAMFTGLTLISAVVLVGAAGVQLPGTNAVKDIINQPKNKPSTKYKLTTEITVTSNGIKQDSTNSAYGFRYKTVKDTGFLSLADSPSLSFFTGAKQIKVEYILRTESGRIVASSKKRAGKIGAFQNKDITFETGNLESGTYTANYIATFQQCSLGSCSRKTEKITKNVEVPKLPLGEY